MTVLVTGASGFVGRALCQYLAGAGLRVRAASRSGNTLPGAMESVPIGQIGPNTEWAKAVREVDSIVHLAARVHVMRDRSEDPLTAFRNVNLNGSQQLARAAARAGVRRLVFVSSIKAMAERSEPGHPLSEQDPAHPCDPYGRSKWEAELALRQIADETGLELVVLRPPLVYGPAVRANFLGLMKLVARGLPLPLACLDNRRSLIYLGNLCDALHACLLHPQAANELFLVADEEPLSTTTLVTELAAALAVRPRLFRVPLHTLRRLGGLIGCGGAIARLTDSLVIDPSKLKRILQWEAPYSVRQGIAETARWFHHEYHRHTA